MHNIIFIFFRSRVYFGVSAAKYKTNSFDEPARIIIVRSRRRCTNAFYFFASTRVRVTHPHTSLVINKQILINVR